MLAVLTFAEALVQAQAAGARIARKGWNGRDQWVAETGQVTAAIPALTEVDGKRDYELRNLEPFMVLKNAQGDFVPWVPSQGDMAAVDWMVLL